MIRKNILVHITNNKIYIKNKNKIIEEETIYTEELNKHKTVVDGKVYEYTYFLNLMQNIVIKYKLNNSILKNDITIIINTFTTPLEIQAIKNIFKTLSFNKIKVYKEIKVFNKIIDDNKMLLNINKNYTEIFQFKKELKVQKRIKNKAFLSYNQYLSTVIEIIYEIIHNCKNNKPLLIAYGEKKEIKKISKVLEKRLKVKISNFENNSQLIDYL